ncbi:PAS domain-containing protein [Paraflavisolibacter sp. H34]|uniref:PAS domain-containing sensor histidine kinase n=1 Tax=Huijunlia imazamoxiresistens TaxID=3127457 RepID=UPI003017A000
MERRVFEAMPGISALLRPDAPQFTILAVTDDYVQVTGQGRENLVGKEFFETFPAVPDLYSLPPEEKLRAAIHQVLLQKDKCQLPVLRHDRVEEDGRLTEKHWTVLLKPVLDATGAVQYIIYSAVDVSDQVRAEKRIGRIRLAEQSYNLFMQAPVAICIIRGPEQVIELANDSVLEIWRRDRSVIGKTVLEAMPELRDTVFPDLLHRVRREGRPHYAQESHAWFIRNGREEKVYFNFVYQPYYEEGQSEPVGVLAVASEVTEQVVARKKVEESEQRLRNLISEAAVATAVYTGPDMRIQYANDAMIRLWGKNPSVIDKTVREALPELEGQPFHQLLEHVYTTGETYWGKEDKGEIEVDGQLQTFYFNFSYKALRDADGRIYGILNMAIDVTEQVLARQKVRESEANLQQMVEERTIALANKNRELERTNANLEEFAYAASHDMKEPVRKIHFFADRLQQRLDGKLDQEDQRLFERMRLTSQRMGALIDDLLTFYQVNRGITQADEVGLDEVVQLVLQDLDLEIEEKQARIQVDGLPRIQGHKRQLQQLFLNLAGNALKYSKPGVPPEVRISCRRINGRETGLPLAPGDLQKPYYVLQVADNGIGFEQKDAERIFHVFTRLHSNVSYRGTGIGLSIARKVVENHKGYILAESEPGVGTAFKVFLPAP